MKSTINEACVYLYDTERFFTQTVVNVENGILTVIRQDLGGIATEYSSDGEVESLLLFDKVNTAKLAMILQVQTDKQLVDKLVALFAPCENRAWEKIREFCDENGIAFKSDVYY